MWPLMDFRKYSVFFQSPTFRNNSDFSLFWFLPMTSQNLTKSKLFSKARRCADSFDAAVTSCLQLMDLCRTDDSHKGRPAGACVMFQDCTSHQTCRVSVNTKITYHEAVSARLQHAHSMHTARTQLMVLASAPVCVCVCDLD